MKVCAQTASTDKVHQCKQCVYACKREDNLKRHVRNKHLNILVACDDCGKSIQSNNLSRHKKTSCPSNKPVTNSIKNNKEKFKVTIEVERLSNGNVMVVTNPIINIAGQSMKVLLMPIDSNDNQKHDLVPNLTQSFDESQIVDGKFLKDLICNF